MWKKRTIIVLTRNITSFQNAMLEMHPDGKFLTGRWFQTQTGIDYIWPKTEEDLSDCSSQIELMELEDAQKHPRYPEIKRIFLTTDIVGAVHLLTLPEEIKIDVPKLKVCLCDMEYTGLTTHKWECPKRQEKQNVNEAWNY